MVKKDVSQDTVELLKECDAGCKMAINSMEQIGRHELYFEDCNNELKREITRKLRRYFNKMRTAKPGEIKNPRN